MAVTRVPVPPEMILWACERAGFDVAQLETRMPQLPAWVRRERNPTLKQLEKLAKLTHTPLGYLFLPSPPTNASRCLTIAPWLAPPEAGRALICSTRST